MLRTIFIGFIFIFKVVELSAQHSIGESLDISFLQMPIEDQKLWLNDRKQNGSTQLHLLAHGPLLCSNIEQTLFAGQDTVASFWSDYSWHSLGIEISFWIDTSTGTRTENKTRQEQLSKWMALGQKKPILFWLDASTQQKYPHWAFLSKKSMGKNLKIGLILNRLQELQSLKNASNVTDAILWQVQNIDSLNPRAIQQWIAAKRKWALKPTLYISIPSKWLLDPVHLSWMYQYTYLNEMQWIVYDAQLYCLEQKGEGEQSSALWKEHLDKEVFQRYLPYQKWISQKPPNQYEPCSDTSVACFQAVNGKEWLVLSAQGLTELPEEAMNGERTSGKFKKSVFNRIDGSLKTWKGAVLKEEDLLWIRP